MIAVLAGGGGGPKLTRGLAEIIPAEDITVIVNTGDDETMHGLRICPDLDSCTYVLSGSVNPETGWGLAGETWVVMDALTRFATVVPPGSTAGSTWFGLGDRDLATHLYRTQRLREGADLATATAEIARAFGIAMRLLPMTTDRVATMVTLAGPSGRQSGQPGPSGRQSGQPGPSGRQSGQPGPSGRQSGQPGPSGRQSGQPGPSGRQSGHHEVSFQEYFVHRRHAVPISGVRFDGIERARPGPGVLAALEESERIVIGPSNPFVSIGPILAVAGVRPVLARRRDDVVAISPIVAGAALKGPAARMLTELGHEASVVGIAELYADVAGTLVIDDADAGAGAAVEARGMRCVVASTVMHSVADAAGLATVTIS